MMGYNIQAAVSSHHTTLALAKSRSCAQLIELRSGLAMIPLTAELYDEINNEASREFDNPAFSRFFPIVTTRRGSLKPARCIRAIPTIHRSGLLSTNELF